MAFLAACAPAEESNSSPSDPGGPDDQLAPIADAGANQETYVGATVTLDASGSSDSDGRIDSYAWRQIGGIEVAINDSGFKEADFLVPEAARATDLTFELTVVDNDYNQASDSVVVTVLDDSVPVADAGADVEAYGGTTVELNASNSSAAGGSIATYQWQQIHGREVAVSGVSSALASFIAPDIGEDSVLLFELTVTNTNGANDTDTIAITVLENALPTADAQAQAQAYKDQSVELDGSASADVDGSIVAYLWTQTAGPAVSIVDPNAASTSFTTPIVDVDTELIFQLTVTDDKGAQGSTEVAITVLGNTPPTAQASAAQSADEGAIVVLDGSASADSDGVIASYSWQQVNSSHHPVTLVEPSSARPSFTAPLIDADTELDFWLTVTDDKGAKDTATLSIAIINNIPPSAQASAAQSADEGTTVQLNGSASADSDGSITSYSWRQIDSSGYSVSLVEPESAQPSFSAPFVDADIELSFELTVTDNDGDTSSASVAITIVNNIPPIAQAGGDNRVYENNSFELDASASADSDGSIASYWWQQINISEHSIDLSDPASAQPSFTAPAVAADFELSFELTVTDNDGDASSDSIVITVLDNIPPVAQASAEARAYEGSSVQLDASASSDADGIIVYYFWQQTVGPKADIANPEAETTSFLAPAVDDSTTLAFQLTVADVGQASDTASVAITILDNTAPSAQAGADQEVYEGTSVRLDASASSDAENNIVDYLWQQSTEPVISIANPQEQSIAFTAPDVAADTNLSFHLTVTDSANLIDTDTVVVTVLDNTAPIANAGSNQRVNESTSVQLDASASSDAEDHSLDYLWQQVDSSAYPVELDNANSATPSFDAPAVAADTELIFQLTVTDSLGKSSDANVSITVVYNAPPTAEAGDDKQVNENQLVQLDASASSDAEDQASDLDYLWLQVDSSGYSIKLSEAQIAQPTFTTPEVAADTDLIFQLTVTDSLGKSSDANVTISVVYNAPPSAQARAVPQEVYEGLLAQLDAAASSDAEDTDLEYSWTQVDSSGYRVDLSDPNSAQPTFTAPEVEANTELVFRLTVNDSLGKSSETDITISVLDNSAPSANAVAEQELYEGKEGTLDASASTDAESNIVSYLWQQTAGLKASIEDPKAAITTFTAPEVDADTELIFELTITDAAGASESIQVSVAVLNNTAPSAHAAISEQKLYEGKQGTLDAAASTDVENNIVAYLWQQSAGTEASIDDPKAATTTFTAPEVTADTKLSFELTVTDAAGATATDSVAITVFNNTAPSAKVEISKQQPYEGEAVTLDAAASTDAENNIAAYLWQQSAGPTIAIADLAAASISFTAPEVDADTELAFELTVTDAAGASDNTTVVIAVLNNNPPKAHAGDSQQVNENQLVSLDGSESKDSEDSSLDYLWQQVDSSGYSVTLIDPKTTTPTFTTPFVAADTELTFQLTVSDSLGKSSDANVSIAIIYNNPPKAHAGDSQEVNENQLVSLDGSASSDLEDDSLDYLWQQVDSSSYSVDLDNANIARPTFTTPEVAADTELTFQLTVTDSLGKSSDANVSIAIIYNSPPQADAGENQQVNENQLVYLDGSGSKDDQGSEDDPDSKDGQDDKDDPDSKDSQDSKDDPDSKDSSLDFFWQQVDSSGYLIKLSEAQIAKPTFTTPEVKADTDLIFQLTVTDSLGKSSDAKVTISVVYNNPPSADAGKNQSVIENGSVALDGSASSDVEDQASSLGFSWQQVDSSGYSVSLANSDTAQPSFTTPFVKADTDLIFQLTVTDSLGKSSDANTTISVVYNAPPSAHASASSTKVNESATVELDGSASKDIDGSIKSYLWQQVDSSDYRVDLSNPNIDNPTFTTPFVIADTDLIFQLTVTDSLGKSSDANVTISVVYNAPPIADAGNKQSVIENGSVTLDGSASKDIDGSIKSYLWQQVDSSDYRVDLSNPNIDNPTFTTPFVIADTDLIFQLTVTDSLGKSSDANVTISVVYNAPPSAHAGADKQVNESTTVELDGSQSTDSDGIIAVAWWQQIDSSGHIVTLSAIDANLKTTFTAPEVEADTELTFQLTVTDNLGKISTATVTITVLYNAPPIAHASASSTKVYAGTTVELYGSQSADSDGIIAVAWWQQIDLSGYQVQLSAIDATLKTTFTAPEVAADTELIFQISVTDNLGKSSTDTVTITVLYNVPPSADAGADQSVIEANKVQLNGSASADSDGSIASYSWQQVDSSGHDVDLSDANIAKPTFAAPAVAAETNLTFQLTVTDDAGDTGSDSVVITVFDDVPPTVDAGIDNNQSVGTIARLRGSAQHDLHSIVSYLWQETTSFGVDIDRADSANASFIVPTSLAVGDVLRFQLTATDSSGASASASTSITIAKAGTLKWFFDIGGQVRHSIAIGPDGTVYLGSLNNNLYALNPQDGSIQWQFAAGNDIRTPPSIGADGTIYFGSYDKYIHAVSPPTDGSQSGIAKWNHYTNVFLGDLNSVSIAADGSLYFGSKDNSLYALDPDTGEVKWSYPTGGQILDAPAISPGGTIYFGSADDYIYAIDPPSDGGKTGELVWSHYTDDSAHNFASPAIDAEGTVYSGGNSNDLYVISADGNSKWSYPTGDPIRASPAIGTDGTIYFGSNDNHLYALDHDTREAKWTFKAKNDLESSPAIGADGIVYFGSDDKNVYALDPTDGELIWKYTLGALINYASSAIASDGTLFIGDSFGLYAIHTTSAGLADSPWPKFGQNNANTGRANLAPSAQAQASAQTVSPGASLSLDASASSDPDGVIIDYYWRETSGYGISILNNNSAQASFTAPTPSSNDTLSIELTVTDNSNSTDTTTLDINIEL